MNLYLASIVNYVVRYTMQLTGTSNNSVTVLLFRTVTFILTAMTEIPLYTRSRGTVGTK